MAIRTNVSYTRMLLACLVIISAAYWAGGRWGQRQPIGVSALQPNAGAGKRCLCSQRSRA